jgi:predicted MFS family arabinose efflux permease
MLNKTLQLYKSSFSGFSREVWLLSLVMLINRSGTMVIPFLSVYLTQVKGYTLIQAGWVMTFFGAGSVLGSYIGGKLTDSIGYYKVQFWSLFGAGLSFIMLGYADHLFSICLVVFLASTIADAFRPANFAAIAAYSEEKDRTRAIALVRMAINLGWAIGPAVGGFIAVKFGYKWLFWIDGLTCIGAAFFFLLSLKEKRTISTAQSTDASINITSIWKDHAYLLLLLFTLINAIAFMQLFTALPVFLKQDVALDEHVIGQLMAMNGLLIAIIEMPLIFVLERRFKSWQIIGFGTLLIGLSYIVFNFFGHTGSVAILSMLLMTLGEMLSLPFIATLALGFSNEHNRGQYMALFSMAYSLAHIAAPNVGMQIAGRYGFSSLWWVILMLCILAWAGFRIIGSREKEASVLV